MFEPQLKFFKFGLRLIKITIGLIFREGDNILLNLNDLPPPWIKIKINICIFNPWVLYTMYLYIKFADYFPGIIIIFFLM